MRSVSSNPAAPPFRRARPLLGTFVEVAVLGDDPAEIQTAACDAAFDAVAQVEALMSRHRPDSDIGRLNRGQTPPLHPWTQQVMEFCDRLGRDSKGVFNIRTTGVIDLGGVAKGFAVDRAVDALKSHGIDAGIVNAGGDMAVFGPRPQAVHRRDPAQPARLLPPIGVFNAALASSAPAFDPVTGSIAPDSAIVDPRTGAPAAGALGASVRAPQAMAADALTKLVMILGGQAWSVLALWQADGWLVRRDGGQDRTPGWMEG